MHPRAKSTEAQKRYALLQQISEKRSQQQQRWGTAAANAIPSCQEVDLEDSTDEERTDDMRELEDFSSPENKPPTAVKNEEGGHKPIVRLSRLKRNTSTEPKARNHASNVDGLLQSIQNLNIAKQGVADEPTSKQSYQTLAQQTHISFQPLGNVSNARKALLEAAACKLPVDDEAAESGEGSSVDSEQDDAQTLEQLQSDDGSQHSPDNDLPGQQSDSSEQSSPPSSDSEASEPLATKRLPDRQQTSVATNQDTDDLRLGDQQEYTLPATLHSKLYPHQVEGVRWLWSLFKQRRGGILGDDMGLGKTMQCCAFLAGLLNSKLATRALVIAPKTLLMHWQKELEVCGLGRRTRSFFGGSQTERESALRYTSGSSGGVLLTTYGMVLHNAGQLSTPAQFRSWGAGKDDSRDFEWDVIILDEGHKVKNPKMKLVQELRRIPSGITVIISGTPIQNNLGELHALFDLCCQGLLSDNKTFKRVYEKHITAGQDKNATTREREVGAAVAAELRRVIAPFFLRREKRDVLRTKDAAESSASTSNTAVNSGDGNEDEDATAGVSRAPAQFTAKPQGLPHKNDMVVWLKLQPLQRAVYLAFLHSDTVKRALNETESPLAALTVLKKICDHPALLSEAAADAVIAGGHRWAKAGQSPGNNNNGSGSDVSDDEYASPAYRRSNKADAGGNALSAILQDLGSDVRQQLMNEMAHKEAHASCKTAFVLSLLDELCTKGHKTLVFSQSRVMLDILQAAVVARGLAYCRVDGSIGSAEERQAQVQRFQQPGSKISVFLLTSQVGGLGLTLTAADRVIIVDPSWNPAVDNQAVDRAYRIGQTRDVVVYRLITCGTVEEKIYRKQVFKGGLSRTGTEGGIQFRYFTMQQLKDLFMVSEEGLNASTTQQQLAELHEAQRVATQDLKQHLKRLEGLKGFAGISDHDLLFSSKPAESDAAGLTATQQAALANSLETAAAREGARGNGSGKERFSGGDGFGNGAGMGDLSAMFSNAMKLGTAATVSDPHQQLIIAQQQRVMELSSRLDSLRSTFEKLGPKMADGGAKLFKQKEALAMQLAQEQAKLQALQSGDDRGSISTPATPSDVDHKAAGLPGMQAQDQHTYDRSQSFQQDGSSNFQANAKPYIKPEPLQDDGYSGPNMHVPARLPAISDNQPLASDAASLQLPPGYTTDNPSFPQSNVQPSRATGPSLLTPESNAHTTSGLAPPKIKQENFTPVAVKVEQQSPSTSGAQPCSSDVSNDSRRSKGLNLRFGAGRSRTAETDTNRQGTSTAAIRASITPGFGQYSTGLSGIKAERQMDDSFTPGPVGNRVDIGNMKQQHVVTAPQIKQEPQPESSTQSLGPSASFQTATSSGSPGSPEVSSKYAEFKQSAQPGVLSKHVPSIVKREATEFPVRSTSEVIDLTDD